MVRTYTPKRVNVNGSHRYQILRTTERIGRITTEEVMRIVNHKSGLKLRKDALTLCHWLNMADHGEEN